jgi:tetratricopeptide (TPR) repeat protein
MHKLQLISLSVVILLALSLVASAQPPLSGTFLLGANWVDLEQFHTVKTDLHFNYLFCGLTTGRLQAAAAEGLYIAGCDNGDGNYWGISGLAPTEAGRYWAAADSFHNLLQIPMWLRPLSELTGGDRQVYNIPGYPNGAWVRYAEVDSPFYHQPGIMIDSLHAGLTPFLYSRVGDHNYYLRIYGRRLSAPVGHDTILKITADWYDYEYTPEPHRFAKWITAQSDTVDTCKIIVSDLGTNWTLSSPKHLWVKNPGDSGSYWRGNLSLYWPGNCDLEIYYVTISDGMGDSVVYNPQYDDAIEAAATHFDNYPALFRHFMVDEPTWNQIWPSQRIDSIIYEVSSLKHTTADLVNMYGAISDRRTDMLWRIEMGQELYGHMDEFFTWFFPIRGNRYDDSIPNPYDTPAPSFSEYDLKLNYQSPLGASGLSALVQNLTDLVWNARKDYGPRNFWFYPQAHGIFLQTDSASNTWVSELRHPTPEEFRCMTWIAVACGAKGIVPYLYSSTELLPADPRYFQFPRYEIGVVDSAGAHDVNWCNLSGVQQYVGWQSSYEEMKSLYTKLDAIGPKLMQLEYAGVDPNYIAGIEETGTDDPLDPHHYFLSYFDDDALSDPDGQAEYFALVNRNCWPLSGGGTRLYDILADHPGWILEDLASHELFQADVNGDFTLIPFAAGQGRVFRLAPTARWFGTTNVALDMTVPNDITLYVDSDASVYVGDDVSITVDADETHYGTMEVDQGAEFRFGQDAGILVEGRLTATGGSGANEEITFTSDTTGGDWDGIEFSSQGTSQSNLSYCQIHHARSAVKITYQHPNLEVDHCTITGNTVGVHILASALNTTCSIHDNVISGNSTFGVAIEHYNGSGLSGSIQYNTICLNDHAGIVLVNANPRINDDSLSGNGDGVICTGTSAPLFYDATNTGGYNTITANEQYGIKIVDTAAPNLGCNYSDNPGYNNIYDNANWEIYNTSTSLIFADMNWWGTATPNFAELIYDTSRVRIRSRTDQYNVRADGFVGREGSKPKQHKDPGDGPSGPGPLLQTAFQLLYSGNPQQAAPLFQQIIVNFPNLPEASQALMGLYQAYLNLQNLPGFSTLLSNIINNLQPGLLEENASYLQSVVNRSLGNASQALEIVQELAQTATQANIVELSKFDEGRIYKYDLNLPAIGDSLMLAFIEDYPEGDLSILAQVELGLIDPPSTTLAGLGEPNTITSVTPLPDAFSVKAAYPNPFNPATTLSFSLPEVAKVTLNVFDVQGRLVATLVNGLREAGQHQVTFDGSNLSSGVYLYTLQAGSHSATGKMVLMK